MTKNYLLAFALLFGGAANAQEPIQGLLATLNPICTKLIEEDLVREMAEVSSVPLNGAKICECAADRFSKDKVVEGIVQSTREQRERGASTERTMYFSAKFYSASLACYSEAITASAGGIKLKAYN